ncbi:HK97 family phage major capsid protein [Novosphingobium sp. SG751A]|uniref:phage major capsid protein n=1 Tax=Novosphingobium sp. SG751A TaxID=2587000 RepID=UPI0015559DC0|nr:phage major capsid protein [Novosphingobium sp. SG751A]NOW44097.1 HK97 family phage major capsid protein [Novosphingobium sp. SG751A]
MNMMTPIRRFRGPALVRAETPTPAATLDAINRAVTEMRAKYDEELAAVRNGQSDIVRTEEVNRINAAITELTNTLNAQQEAIAAAAALGGNGRNTLSAEARQHAETFNRWFRRGDQAAEAALGDLQVRAGLTTQSDPDGGWLMPEEMDRTITRVLSVVSAMRGLSRVISTATGEYSALVSQGGAGAGWVGEESARPDTGTPQLSKIELETGEIYANPAATQRVLDDGFIDIAQWLADEISITFAEQEGAAFISGNGINKPRGILSYTPVANSSYAWGKVGFVVTGGAAAFAASSPTDALMDLYYSLKAGYRNGASFVTSDAVLGTIRKFKDGQGNYIWAPPTADMPGTILGKPVMTDDNMPALGAGAFPVAFGNFQRAYTIVDRMGTRVLRDPYTAKPYVKFYTTKRVGGGITNFEAIKLLKCST